MYYLSENLLLLIWQEIYSLLGFWTYDYVEEKPNNKYQVYRGIYFLCFEFNLFRYKIKNKYIEKINN